MLYEADMIRATYPHSLVRETSRPLRWSYRSKNDSTTPTPDTSVSLEDEIVRLRKSMEDAYVANQSLTADIVIEISRMLDIKILEYMRKSR
ncbi:aspartyl-phosphate phosphatase Spo0E family protein [Paenibacillus koleovorans]|uniref:aspartyl-phosphate phosphatase Spo0E family protein n=1 Tax=Paenibacillus koleovorans TaxID=121608 RepID=UPI001FE3F3F7|nr:aspartyl-phosphate phosphatase Spo0E family protein [Paenibacillus koleovorans]